MEAATASAVVASVGAVGTIGTLVANSFQIWRLQRREDEFEQANLISAWVDPDGNGARLTNRSAAPVYNIVVCQVFVQGAAPRNGHDIPEDHRLAVQVLPPERVVQKVAPLPGSQGMNTVPGIELAFRDSRLRSWVRTADGTLRRLENDIDPISYYNLNLPVGWTAARPIAGTGFSIAV